MLLLWLAAGGVAGTLGRYGLSRWVYSWAGTGFPWGTFLVNAAGCLLLGFASRTFDLHASSAELRGLVAVGFCGAFTTFSTFSLETVVLVQDGQWARAAAYVLGSTAVGLAALVAGLSCAGALYPAGG